MCMYTMLSMKAEKMRINGIFSGRTRTAAQIEAEEN